MIEMEAMRRIPVLRRPHAKQPMTVQTLKAHSELLRDVQHELDKTTLLDNNALVTELKLPGFLLLGN